MARYPNEKSEIQRSDEVFAGICTKIRRYTPDYLATLGEVSRQTFYKYLRGEAINESTEDAILDTLQIADKKQKEKEEKRLERAKALALS